MKKLIQRSLLIGSIFGSFVSLAADAPGPDVTVHVNSCGGNSANPEVCPKFRAGADYIFHNRKDISYENLNDNGELSNVKELAIKASKRPEVASFFGYVGKEAAEAILPTVESSKKVLITLSSSEDLIDGVKHPYSYSLRKSQAEDIKFFFSYLEKMKLGKKIAVLAPPKDEKFISDFVNSTVKKVFQESKKMESVGVFSLDLSDKVSKKLAGEIMKKKPDAVLVFGKVFVMSASMRSLREAGFNGPFFFVFYHDMNFMADVGGVFLKDVYFARHLPMLTEKNVPIVKEYLSIVPEAAQSFDSFEGYVHAKVLAGALEKISGKRTGESLKASLDNYQANLGGVEVKFTKENHHGIEKLWLYKFNQNLGYDHVEF